MEETKTFIISSLNKRFTFETWDDAFFSVPFSKYFDSSNNNMYRLKCCFFSSETDSSATLIDSQLQINISGLSSHNKYDSTRELSNELVVGFATTNSVNPDSFKFYMNECIEHVIPAPSNEIIKIKIYNDNNPNFNANDTEWTDFSWKLVMRFEKV